MRMPEARLAGHRVVLLSPDHEKAQAVAAELLAARLEPRRDLVGVQGPRIGSGRSDGEFWRYEGWFLKSRGGLVFRDSVQAEAAFHRLRDMKLKLGALVPAHALLALLADRDGQFQVWTVAPFLLTLREQLDAAAAARDETAMARALAAYARGLGLTLELAVEQGLSLDPNPSNFASQGGQLRYIDDDVALHRGAIGLEDAFLARFTEYPATPEAVWTAYVNRFAGEVLVSGGGARWEEMGLSQRFLAAARLRQGTERWARVAVERVQEVRRAARGPP